MPSMTPDEREQFLADLHVGVLAVERAGGPPLAVPVWYDYSPGGDVVVITDDHSLKYRLLRQANRCSLCVQDESPPYRYVSVEGPIVRAEPADRDTDVLPMAQRYLGEEMGRRYAEAGGSPAHVFAIAPQRWWSVDYSRPDAG